MARWQPAKTDVIDALATEILQNYSTGRIAVDGDALSGADAFADDLAAVLRERGSTVSRGGPDDAFDTDLGIVSGEFLQVPGLAGRWRFSVWVEGAGEDSSAAADYLREVGPRAKATAIIDNRDPEHPRRRFADSC